jgi:hypothetical protein
MLLGGPTSVVGGPNKCCWMSQQVLLGAPTTPIGALNKLLLFFLIKKINLIIFIFSKNVKHEYTFIL